MPIADAEDVDERNRVMARQLHQVGTPVVSAPRSSTDLGSSKPGRLWFLVVVALVDLCVSVLFRPNSNIFNAPNPSQSRSTISSCLIAIGYLRPIICACIGASRKWMRAQPWVLVAVVATWLAVLWEINLLVQWRSWDQKQLDEWQGSGTLRSILVELVAKGRTERVTVFLVTVRPFYFSHLTRCIRTI